MPGNDLRYEVKATAPEAYRAQLDAALRLHPEALRTLYPPRRINNIYFDSPDLSRASQNLDGLANRCKLRYRWYGESTQGWPGALEFKRKFGALGDKMVFAVETPLDLRGMSWRDIWRVFHDTLPPELHSEASPLFAPILINRYSRRYLATPDRSVRVTVDTDQQFLPQWNRTHPNLSLASPPIGELVVEVKAARHLSDRVDAIVQALPIAIGKNSKYMMGLMRSGLLALLLMLTACGPPAPPEFPAAEGSQVEIDGRPCWFPSEFRSISLRTRSYDPIVRGNSLQAFRAAPRSGVVFAEADFRLDADGILIASHDPDLEGDCGRVADLHRSDWSRCELGDRRRVATLDDWLTLPFREYYLDLKDTDDGDSTRAHLAVVQAIAAVQRHGRSERAILFLYEPTPEMLALVGVHGIRAGLKADPADPVVAMGLVDRAAQAGLELVCLDFASATPQLIEAAAERGVWVIAWYAGQRDPDAWTAPMAAGLGGLMTGYQPEVAPLAAKAWRNPVRVQ